MAKQMISRELAKLLTPARRKRLMEELAQSDLTTTRTLARRALKAIEATLPTLPEPTYTRSPRPAKPVRRTLSPIEPSPYAEAQTHQGPSSEA
jgi:hypothetical protein